MNNSYSSEISDAYDEYPEVTQDDLNRAVFRVGLKPASSDKQQVSLLLDTVLIDYFKAKAGERDWQEMISDTLRRAVAYENLEDTLRRIVREELHMVKDQ
jgi:uncharacterized protein (DUF4415 family)